MSNGSSPDYRQRPVDELAVEPKMRERLKEKGLVQVGEAEKALDAGELGGDGYWGPARKKALAEAISKIKTEKDSKQVKLRRLPRIWKGIAAAVGVLSALLVGAGTMCSGFGSFVGPLLPWILEFVLKGEDQGEHMPTTHEVADESSTIDFRDPKWESIADPDPSQFMPSSENWRVDSRIGGNKVTLHYRNSTSKDLWLMLFRCDSFQLGESGQLEGRWIKIPCEANSAIKSYRGFEPGSGWFVVFIRDPSGVPTYETTVNLFQAAEVSLTIESEDESGYSIAVDQGGPSA